MARAKINHDLTKSRIKPFGEFAVGEVLIPTGSYTGHKCVPVAVKSGHNFIVWLRTSSGDVGQTCPVPQDATYIDPSSVEMTVRY